MRLVHVSVETSGHDPRRDVYRHRYRYGLAVCEDHGRYEGWTEDLDEDGSAAWIEWRCLVEHDHTGCRCLDEDREACLGPDATTKRDSDLDRSKVRLNLEPGHQVGICRCGGEVRYDPDLGERICTNDCDDGPSLWFRNGQPAPAANRPRGGAAA